jgi:arylsulfatase A-like enzyme
VRPIVFGAVAALVLGAAVVWRLVFAPSEIRPSGDAAARCSGCNLLLVVLDAARADHFGCYGYDRPTTPNIDRLAEESVVFERAVSNASFTIGSVASLLSGLPPGRHGVVDNGSVLSQKTTTLAEVLASRGYRTAAFTENPLIDRDFGYGQGFQEFRQLLPEQAPGEDLDLSQSRAHVAEMVTWIERAMSDAPFFLYAHFLRPHNPYHALPVHTGRFSQGYSGELRGRTLELVIINAGWLEPSESDLQQLIDLYAENLLSADALVGELIEALRQRGLLESTIVVVTSDHGEAFLEHDWVSHGFQVFQEDVHVPFLIRFPSALSVSPRRENALVQLTDLMPTVLAALDVSEGMEIPGRNLMPLLGGGNSDRRRPPVVSHGKMAVSLRDGDLKFIRETKGPRDQRRMLLFDLSADPRELQDLASLRESEAARMRVRLSALLEQQKRRSIAKPARQLDPDRIEKLRALGYLE